MDNVEHWKNFKGEEFKIVNGKLELDNIILNDDLHLQGCTSLVYLPDCIIHGNLNLKGCVSLEYLPDCITVYGLVDISNCPSLKTIGKNIYELIIFDQYEVSTYPQEVYTNERIIPITGSVRFSSNQPETIKLQYVGKRLINLIDDPRIYGTRYAEAIITGLNDYGNFEIEIEGQ